MDSLSPSTEIAISSASELGKLPYYEFRALVESPALTPFSGWDPWDISNAIQLHDQGQFYNSELLYHAMTKETRIGSALERRVHRIRNFPFSMQYPSDTPQRIKRMTVQLEQNFNELFPNHAMTEILRRVVMFGFCIARHHLKIINGQIIPVIVPWTHSTCRYDYNDRCFYVQTQDGEEIAVTGDPWIVFSSGGARPWLNGAIRKLAFAFNLINLSFDRWMYFNDVEATAIRHISGPRMTRETAETGGFVRNTQEARGGDTVYSPEGFTFDLVTSGGRASAYQTFLNLVKTAHNEVSIVLLGNNLTQEVEGGSLAAAKVSESSELIVTQSDIEFLQVPLYENTSRIWIEKNFTPAIYGTDSLLQYRWKPYWNVKDDIDRATDSESCYKYSQAIVPFLSTVMQANLSPALPINWEETAKKCGVILHSNRMDGIENE